MRKQYSATYKAEIVKELLKEEKTLNQLAAETGIHPSQLRVAQDRVTRDCQSCSAGMTRRWWMLAITNNR